MKHTSIVLILFSSLAASAASETKEFDSEAFRTVEVKNEAGTVKITGSDSPKSTVTVEKVQWSDKCGFETDVKHSKLTVKVEKKSNFSTTTCKANLTLTVPVAVFVDVAGGVGDLEIKNTKGEVQYKLGVGNVNIDGQVDSLDGKSGKGNATVKGLTGTANLKAGSGDFNLTYKSVPTKGELSINTGKGDAVIMMPAKAKIKTEFRAAMGTTHNDFGDAKDAPFKVSFKSGMGDLNIKKLQ